jgi:cobalt-zinc-cadmium efflux system outer membrane protein
MHLGTLASVLLAMAALCGCRSAGRSIIASPVADAPVPSQPAAPDEAAVIEPTGTVTLADALALALMRNPGLKTFPYSLRAAGARMLQAGLRPNPELQVELEEFGGSGERSGFDAAETTVQIGQPIELGDKRTKRTRVAAANKELVQWDYESARLDLTREVSQVFTAVLAAQERLALAEKVLDLSQQAHTAVVQRVQAGRDSPVDALRAGVVLSESRIERQKAEKTLAAARRSLAAMWGSSTPAFTIATGEWYEVPTLPAIDLSPDAIMANPDVARWEAEQLSRRAALDLERAKAVPDVTAAGGVRRFEETDDSAFVLGLAVPLPLFDRNQGGIEEAIADLGAARQRYEAVRIKTLAALSEAAGALAASHEEVTALKSEVVPAAQQAFEAVQQGYRQGKFDYLYVLDTQRTLFETQARYLDSTEAYHKARADVERLTGRPLDTESNDGRPLNPVEEPSSQVK